MTISRIVLRLEVDDDCKLPQHLNYSADQFDTEEESNASTEEYIKIGEKRTPNREPEDKNKAGSVEKSPVLAGLSYAAAASGDRSRVTIGDGLATVLPGQNTHPVSRKEIALYRGRREVQSISIYTYVPVIEEMAAEIQNDRILDSDDCTTPYINPVRETAEQTLTDIDLLQSERSNVQRQTSNEMVQVNSVEESVEVQMDSELKKKWRVNLRKNIDCAESEIALRKSVESMDSDIDSATQLERRNDFFPDLESDLASLASLEAQAEKDEKPERSNAQRDGSSLEARRFIDEGQKPDYRSGSSETGSEAQRGGSKLRGGVGNVNNVGMSMMRFVSGNPSVELTEGILHLYKEDLLTPVSDATQRSEMICLLNVPATLTTQDLLLFLSPIHSGLEHIKIIRGNLANEYMVLVKFRSQINADEFFRSYNNQAFNTIEPEICHMAYVARVESIRAADGGGLPIPGVTELPVCTVCLERMDESVDCILTILCNHSFHSACLTKWDDTSCPVCRYIQTPIAVAEHKCSECGSQENLWMCLICGIVGCGRYDEGHAYLHFKDTAHTYSMQLGSNRVWDYAGDNYVHRLVQNKADGKLVQVDEGGREVHEEKVDSLALEYTYLLTSQLEAQRLHFEDKLEQVELHSMRQVEELERRVKEVMEEGAKKDQQIAALNKEKQMLEKRCQQLQTKVTKLTSDVSDEREMNECLRRNQTDWQTKVEKLDERLNKKDSEIADLQDQLRDLMFFLEAKQTLSNNTEFTQSEIEGGQIIVNSPGGATGGVGSPADGSGSAGGSGTKKIRRKPRSGLP